jgi:hypothetical protein
MENKDFVDFLKSLLVKIENVESLMGQDCPKHIPAYNKMLGIQQKLSGLESESKINLLPQIVKIRSAINYFMNGRYDSGYRVIIALKKEIIDMCLHIRKNERDNNS